MDNILASKGTRQPIQVDVTDAGQLVSAENDDRMVLVMFNVGPDTAWGNKTLETATPEEGFPILPNGGIVDGDSYDAWYFTTDTGDTADIRGWEVNRP